MPLPPARTLPRSLVPEGGGSGGVGAREPWGCRPSKAPQARGPLPGWVFPSRGGRREAGRGRGRFGKATSPGFPTAPAQAVSPPHPGRGWVRTPGGGRLGAPHQRARGRAGFARSMWEPLQRDTLPSLPQTCCVITPRSRGSPPKANGGCVPLPERWPGGAAQSGSSVFGSFSPAVSRSRNFLRPGPGSVRGSRAVPGGPRGRGEPHTPGRVYM